MKICTKCKQLKELNNFYYYKKGYYSSWCSKCRADKERERRILKNEEIAIKAKIKYEKNKEKIKEKRKQNREKIRIYEKQYYQKNKEKLRAKWLIASRIRRKLILRGMCIICGEQGQAHHLDYSKPLEIIWLCAKHHGLEHKRYLKNDNSNF